MKFYDITKITVISGKGGDGASSGRREKGVPFGGPSGGDGGKGGSVILKASNDVNTLIDYSYKRKFKAAPGEDGMSHDMYGKDSEDLYMNVPVGTVVKDQETSRIIFQFKKEGEECVIVRGGKGGLGNIHFRNSVRQFPNFSIMGEPGEKKDIILELQLLGDIALIGTPSVGKSSLINAVSNTKVKVGDYPFTTLVPNLGIVKYGSFNFSIVDVPGLISGASEGKGLGNQFLRHVLKAKNWTFVSDISRYESGMTEFADLLMEIVKYIKIRFMGSTEYGYPVKSLKLKFIKMDNSIILEVYGKLKTNTILLLRKQINFVVNKYDIVDDKEILKEYISHLLENINTAFGNLKSLSETGFSISVLKLTSKLLMDNIFVLSAFSRYGLEEFISGTANNLKNFQSKDILEIEYVKPEATETEYIKDITKAEKDFLLDNGYITESDAKYIKIWEIMNEEISRMVFTLPWGNDEAEDWFWGQLDRKGHIRLLERAGIQKGDVMKVKSIYDGVDDKYVMWD